jgi:hypothetical protein
MLSRLSIEHFRISLFYVNEFCGYLSISVMKSKKILTYANSIPTL